MPTESNKEILDRNNDENNSVILDICSIINEVVNYSTVVASEFFHLIPKQTNMSNEQAVIISIFLHIVEMLDGSEILIEKSAITAASLQIRSIFESLLYLEWILQKDVEDRANAYLINDYYGRIILEETFDPNTQRGKELKAKFRQDEYYNNYPSVDNFMKDRSGEITKLKNLIVNDPLLHKIDMLFEGSLGKKKWYYFHGGGNSLEELANKLNKQYQYQILYRELSDIVHGEKNLRRRVLIKEGGFKTIRDPENIQFIALTAISFGLKAIRLMFSYFKPAALNYKEWYLNEIKLKNDWLSNLKVEMKYESSM